MIWSFYHSLEGIKAPVNGHIVVELCENDKADMIRIISGDNVEILVAHDIIGRLMVQCARQPGLSIVLERLLGFEGNEFYVQEWPELVGCCFGEIHFRFQDAVPIGIKKKGSPPSDILLNPPDDMELEEGDMVLVLAEDDDTYHPDPRAVSWALK